MKDGESKALSQVMKQEKADSLVFATNLDKLKPRESFVAHKLLCNYARLL